MFRFLYKASKLAIGIFIVRELHKMNNPINKGLWTPLQEEKARPLSDMLQKKLADPRLQGKIDKAMSEFKERYGF